MTSIFTAKVLMPLKTLLQIVSKQIAHTILLLPITLCLSACANYGTSFTCSDANGLHCMPLSLVDQQINSGEIIEVEHRSRVRDRAMCKAKNCHVPSFTEKPDIKSHKIHRVELNGLESKTDQKKLQSDVLYIK